MDPYLGEIKLLPWNWAPKGWHLCDGALLSISQFSALFSLLGTQYGGNGQTNFALPDLRGRVPVHFGSSYSQGTMTGTETVTLTLNEMPAHNHPFMGTSQAGDNILSNTRALAKVTPTTTFRYAADSAIVGLNPASVQPAGGSQPHFNMQPYLVLNYCIALSGIFPSRN